jgi:hypothetical protein
LECYTSAATSCPTESIVTRRLSEASPIATSTRAFITEKDDLHLPVFEDRSAIQIALAQVVDALCSSHIDVKKAGLLLYALQIGSQNVIREGSIIPSYAVKSLTQSDSGEELAPIVRTCSPDDCAECEDCDTCDDSSLYEWVDVPDAENKIEKDKQEGQSGLPDQKNGASPSMST